MEYYYTNEHNYNFLEELLGLRENMEENHHYPNNQESYLINNNVNWSLDSSFQNNTTNFANIIPSTDSLFDNNYTFTPDELNNFNSSSYALFGAEQQSPPDFTLDSSCTNFDNQTAPYQESDNNNNYYDTVVDIFNGEDGGVQNLDIGAPCKTEALPETGATFNVGRFCPQVVGEKKSKGVKKIKGQPSKNLMAERRRRKRLNDRLSMLRSVVPKISKMDRTSILGDTIDYMKDLLERINGLQEEMDLGSNQLSSMTIFNGDVKPNEVVVKNSPKFDVERRNEDTRIEICCGGKPGLLLSTVTTLEALGLEIQQCVISCFNEFSLQASCSEELNKRAILDSEDIKQALLRNAGFGGEMCVAN